MKRSAIWDQRRGGGDDMMGHVQMTGLERILLWFVIGWTVGDLIARLLT